jgi:hypothetical protein
MANALLDLIDDMVFISVIKSTSRWFMHEVVDEYTVLKEPYDIMVSIERSCQNGDNFKTAAAQSGVSFTGLFFVSCILLMSLVRTWRLKRFTVCAYESWPAHCLGHTTVCKTQR